MKAKYINTDLKELNLSKNKIYYVIAIEFSNLDLPGSHIEYQILYDYVGNVIIKANL